KVRAVTRDPNSSQAKSLANAGATLVAASLEDTAAITKALEGATSLFAMTMPSGGTDAETGQGIAAADAAKAAGVHLVFTSVGSANRQTGIPHFDSKYEVEKHIAKVGVRATILAPVSFMENLYFVKEQLAKGIYAAALPPTRALAQVAVADIGAVAVRVLEDAGRFTGKRFDLASDELTGNDALAILSRVTGHPFRLLPDPARCHPPAHGRGCRQDVRMGYFNTHPKARSQSFRSGLSPTQPSLRSQPRS
ncbi:MAG TPA: NmrA family NAD(P)-binding protein, partial [Terriglobales bacterium]|nr:NmrA family NAD(P)-binding protein [Terriglobales bacterium]